jgi:hypothetical protein
MSGKIEETMPSGGRSYGEDSEKINTADKLNEMLGGRGLEVVADTAVHTAPTGQIYCALFVAVDAVINAIVADAAAPITGTITGISFSAGVWLYGKFASVKLTSGTVLAYLGMIS